MSCEQAQELLSAALDGEITAGERATLEDHLRGCDGCRARQAELAAIDRALRAPAARRVPAPRRLRARLEAQVSHPPRRSRLLAGLALAGAAAIGALVVVVVRRPAPVAFVGPAAEVVVVNARGESERRLTGAALQAGDLVEAQDDPVSLSLGPEARVTLHPGAALRLNGPGRPAAALEGGTALFAVTPGPREFRVTTPAGEVVVLGTEFELSVQPGPSGEAADGRVLVSVRRGGLQAISGGHTLRLSAGEHAAMTPGRPPARLLPSFTGPPPARPILPAAPPAAAVQPPPPTSAPAPVTAAPPAPTPVAGEAPPAPTAAIAAGVAVSGSILRGTIELRNLRRDPPGARCARPEDSSGALVRITSAVAAPRIVGAQAPVRLTVDPCGLTPRVSATLSRPALELVSADGFAHALRLLREPNDAFDPAPRMLFAPVELSSSIQVGGRPRSRVPLYYNGFYTAACDTRARDCGFIAVSEHPYFAVTEASGAFVIEGVPAGRHRLTAWHEAAGSKTVEVTIAAAVTEVKIVLDGGGARAAAPPGPRPPPYRGSGRACSIAIETDSPIARACSEQGLVGAKRAMRELVKQGKKSGVKFECDDCHKNDTSYDLTTAARDNFAKLLAK